MINMSGWNNFSDISHNEEIDDEPPTLEEISQIRKNLFEYEEKIFKKNFPYRNLFREKMIEGIIRGFIFLRLMDQVEFKVVSEWGACWSRDKIIVSNARVYDCGYESRKYFLSETERNKIRQDFNKYLFNNWISKERRTDNFVDMDTSTPHEVFFEFEDFHPKIRAFFNSNVT